MINEVLQERRQAVRPSLAVALAHLGLQELCNINTHTHSDPVLLLMSVCGDLLAAQHTLAHWQRLQREVSLCCFVLQHVGESVQTSLLTGDTVWLPKIPERALLDTRAHSGRAGAAQRSTSPRLASPRLTNNSCLHRDAMLACRTDADVPPFVFIVCANVALGKRARREPESVTSIWELFVFTGVLLCNTCADTQWEACC